MNHQVTEEISSKVCKQCGQNKPLSEFHADIQEADRHKRMCRECTSRYKKRQRQANPEKYRATGAAYQRKWRKGKTYTPSEMRDEALWQVVVSHYAPDGRCLLCRRHDDKLEPDHVVPLSAGGPDEVGNLQPLCRRCNRGSKNKKDDDYRADKGEFARRLQAIFEGLDAELD